MGRLQYNKDEYAAQALAAYYNKVPAAFVRSFGCQQSMNDGERLKGVLLDIGFSITTSPANADVILFNTCAVREHAEQRVFGNIGALKALKDKKPGLLIGLCGCMAEEKSTVDKLRESYPYVDLVVGVDVADLLPGLLLEKLTGRKKVLRVPEIRNVVVEQVPTQRDSAVKAYVPIMYGCDNFCSYCIVPYVRGRERSRASADILKEFKSLIERGYKEITLLGQNVNSYGKGLDEKIDFSDLLTLLCNVPGEYRVRFLTSHPKDATRKMVDTIAANPHLCKHLHLPVQSGSNELLGRMNRKYVVEDYLALIRYAKSVCAEMTFSSDIIIGFPGETEEDFEKTVELVKEVGFTQLFTFIYSKRIGTEAAEQPDDTPHKVKTGRLNRLLAVQEEMIGKVSKPWIGEIFTGVVEGDGREDGMQVARLDNNMIVEFATANLAAGEIVELQITALKGAILKGQLK